MQVVVLDGCADGDTASPALLELLRDNGLTPCHFALAGTVLAPCTGDFSCWVKTPGQCRTRDVGQEIVAAMRDAALVIFLSPVRAGGYSADLKKAVDRLIALIHPFFCDRDGLTRHRPRYGAYPPLLFLGVGDDPAMAATFRDYVGGNAINLMAPRYVCRFVPGGAAGQAAALREALAAALDPAVSDAFPAADPGRLQQACLAPAAGREPAPARAVVLIGSARPKGRSTSEALARELVAALEAGGTQWTLVHASAFIKPGRSAEEALATMLAAPLLVVAAPLYVDGLPYLVSRALESLAARLAAGGQQLRQVAGLLNCGFPEAEHCGSAMRQLGHFAGQTGLAWRGGLALGGGELLQGRPLSEHRWLLRRPRRALALAGSALAAGEAVPAAASRLLARPLMPAWLFRGVTWFYWRWLARSHGLPARALDRCPFPEKP